LCDSFGCCTITLMCADPQFSTSFLGAPSPPSISAVFYLPPSLSASIYSDGRACPYIFGFTRISFLLPTGWGWRCTLLFPFPVFFFFFFGHPLSPQYFYSELLFFSMSLREVFLCAGGFRSIHLGCFSRDSVDTFPTSPPGFFFFSRSDPVFFPLLPWKS